MLKYKKIFPLIIFTLAFFLVRLPRLGNDEINPDAVNWHYRAQQFVVGLKSGQLEKTYQHYHPGVTLMWIIGIPIELAKQITNISTYDQFNFEMFHLVAKLSLVLFQYFLTLLCLYFLSKVISSSSAYLVTALFTFEPFVLGNSRLLHMDMLLTLFMFLGLLISYLSIRDKKPYTYFLTGLFVALSFLTKSVAITLFVYILFVYLYKKVRVSHILFFIMSFSFFTVLLFPALWVKPVFYLKEIFMESERVGVRKGHDQIVLGDFTSQAGPEFYPLVLLVKASPLIVFGVIAFFVLKKRTKDTNFNTIFNYDRDLLVHLFLYYLFYIVLMSFPSKKIDRYVLVVFPLLAFFAYYGYLCILTILKTKTSKALLISLSLLCFWIFPLTSVFPYYFTYTSPILLNARNANAIIGQKPFGMGIFDLKDHILKNYGDYPKLGFIDTKPMKSIYPNSKVFDIRVSGTSSYDLLILGINEDFPENLRDQSDDFKEKSVLYINGLPYWRIYDK